MKKLSMFILAACVGSTAVFAQDTTTTTTHSSMQKTHKMGSGKMGSMKMKDCVMMKDGKMMVMKGGEKMAMDNETTFTNGSKVGTDGMLTKQDGTTKQLKNGDCVYMDGKMVSKMKKGMHKKSAMKAKTETTAPTTPQ